MSYSVGSAITNASIPENEYEETLLKANLMLQLNQSTIQI
jgi:anthranilate/para-aminobenzoate synthase component I